MSIAEINIGSVENFILRGQLRTLESHEVITAIHALGQIGVNILRERPAAETRSLEQEELATEIAIRACSSIRDANIAIISSVDNGVLAREGDTFRVYLPHMEPNSSVG